jgi:hypothetical protein
MWSDFSNSNHAGPHGAISHSCAVSNCKQRNDLDAGNCCFLQHVGYTEQSIQIYRDNQRPALSAPRY